MAAMCRSTWLGRVDYAQALLLQRRLVRLRRQQRIPDTVLFLEHPPVFTLGKRREAAERNILADSDSITRFGATVEACDRGGDVTYHGPGQLVVYPIVHIQELAHRSVRRYVEGLEDVMIDVAAAYDIKAEGRRPDETGAWVGNRKLGAVGVRVEQRVCSHGFAFNVSTDLRAFELIVPCGLADRTVTSLAVEIGGKRQVPELRDVAAAAEAAFGRVLERQVVRTDPSLVLDEAEGL